MEFTAQITMDNAAFDENPEYELGRILREIAGMIEEQGRREGRAVDVNGNSCGTFSITPDHSGKF